MDLANKDIKADTVNMLHKLKNTEEKMNMMRENEDIKKDQKELLEKKST